MAESVLNDVDELIRNGAFTHTRYVDDIRVFSDSERALEELLQTITTYLYEHHRLTLASHKTKIMPTAEFVSEYLESPERLELNEAHARLNDIGQIDDAYDAYHEDETLTEGPPDTNVIHGLMDKLCSLPILDLGLARHVLRRCRKYRIRAIVPQLFDNIEFFAPVMPAVIVYLDRVTTDSFLEHNLEAIAALYDLPVVEVPFVRMWLDNYTSRWRGCLAHTRIRSEVVNSPCVATRAVGARTLKDTSLVRSLKPQVDNLGPFDRREVMRSSLVLAQDERVRWLRRVLRNECAFVDQTVIKWLISQ